MKDVSSCDGTFAKAEGRVDGAEFVTRAAAAFGFLERRGMSLRVMRPAAATRDTCLP